MIFIDDIEVTVKGGELSNDEINYYVDFIVRKYADRKVKSVDIEIDGEYVNLNYKFFPQNFERIRRITGYLVGTTDRWNNGKRAEERDRVKHGITQSNI